MTSCVGLLAGKQLQGTLLGALEVAQVAPGVHTWCMGRVSHCSPPQLAMGRHSGIVAFAHMVFVGRGIAGKTTVNSLYGTRVAVLAGDFLFAQSSWFLANLDNLEVRQTFKSGWGGRWEPHVGCYKLSRSAERAAVTKAGAFDLLSHQPI
jgi:hypothetical protein